MRSAILLFFVLSFFACTNTTKIPDGIMSKQKMELIMWDLIQADRFGSLFLVKDSVKSNLHLENIKLFQRVFQIHNVSKEEFQKSYSYYLSRPDLTRIIFDSIAVKAERQRATLYSPAVK